MRPSRTPALLAPLALRGVELRNRVVISPMQEYAAGTDGKTLEFHLVHLGRFALGGAGLVFTEALAVSPEARLTYGDLGIWDDGHVPPLARIADFVRGQGAAAGAQILHAGRKASVQRPWLGYPPLGDADVRERGEAPWPTVGPSAIPALPDWPVPRALEPGGWQLEDTLVLASELGRRGIDVIDCSSQGLTRRGTPVTTPREPGFQVPYAEAVRRETGIPSCAVGLIMDFEHAERIVGSGQADLVAVGREALRNPNWAAQAAVDLVGPEAYERYWQPRWGWWLVRRAASLARRRGLNRRERLHRPARQHISIIAHAQSALMPAAIEASHRHISPAPTTSRPASRTRGRRGTRKRGTARNPGRTGDTGTSDR